MNRVDSAIVAAVIGLADTVGMTTVAEGVESAAQLEHLRSLGCPAAQGFHLARSSMRFLLVRYTTVSLWSLRICL